MGDWAMAVLAVLTIQQADMLTSAAEAAYKQTRAEYYVNEYMGQLERRYTSPAVQVVLGNTFFITKSLMEQRINVKFEF
jgi:hypothetical protein